MKCGAHHEPLIVVGATVGYAALHLPYIFGYLIFWEIPHLNTVMLSRYLETKAKVILGIRYLKRSRVYSNCGKNSF